MTLRDGIRDQDFGESFELVKKEDPKDSSRIIRKPSKTGQRKTSELKEVNNIIVKCKDEDVKKELVTLITNEVDKLANFAKLLYDPKSAT
eukprot:00721.XXX_409_678_1 [CDS] Oithona nana genome sequencing.